MDVRSIRKPIVVLLTVSPYQHYSKFTTKEAENLSDIARKILSTLVMIAYSWIQIRTEWAYAPLRLCDTIYSLFNTHGLFHLRIAVAFVVQLCENIQYFIQDSFLGFMICLFICVFRLSVVLFYMFSSAFYLFSLFLPILFFLFLLCLFRCFFI